MTLKIRRAKILFASAFVIIVFYSCNNQTINFNFSGRKVLYINEFEEKSELVLLNIDTNEELKFDKFEEIELSDFLLYNDGKNIFVNSYGVDSKGDVFIYEVLKDDKIKIDYRANDMAGFISINIFNNNFYFGRLNKIYAYSLSDFKLFKEYTTDSWIAQFAVYDENLFTVNYNIYDDEHNGYRPSNIYLYDFKNISRKEIPYRALLYEWSKDRKKLLFNSRGPKILEYPSLIVKPIDIIDKDSLEIYGQMNFVGNDEIIFTGFKKGGNHFEETDLYILNLNTEKIEQITNTKSLKEIKSTSY